MGRGRCTLGLPFCGRHKLDVHFVTTINYKHIRQDTGTFDSPFDDFVDVFEQFDPGLVSSLTLHWRKSNAPTEEQIERLQQVVATKNIDRFV